MTTFLIILSIYLVGAVVTYGFARADWDEFWFKMKRRLPLVTQDINSETCRTYCIFTSLLFPMGLVAVLVTTENGIRHAKWRLISKLSSGKE